MIVARIFPKDSVLYKKWSFPLSQFGSLLDDFGIIRLFIIWSLTVTGTVLAVGIEDRFLYWDWSTWSDGLVRILISSLLFLLVLRPRSLWSAGSMRLKNMDFVVHTGLSFLFILIGGVGYVTDWWIFLFNALPYVISFIGGVLVFQIKLTLDKDKGEWFVEKWNNKLMLLGLSGILFGISVILGFYFDDPILSTVSMVSLPFPLVALVFTKHVRHLQRARFYPLLVYSLFLCVRAPWFLIPLGILLFIFRTVNYFRYGIAYPSFGVDFDESAHYV